MENDYYDFQLSEQLLDDYDLTEDIDSIEAIKNLEEHEFISDYVNHNLEFIIE